MLHVSFRFYQSRPIPWILKTHCHHRKLVRLVEPHLSFHFFSFFFFFFLVSFLFLTTAAFLRRLMSLRLSWCVGRAAAPGNLMLCCLFLHTHTHTHSPFCFQRQTCVSLKHFLATSLWKSDFLNQRRLELLWCVFFLQIPENTLAFPIYCCLGSSNWRVCVWETIWNTFGFGRLFLSYKVLQKNYILSTFYSLLKQ